MDSLSLLEAHEVVAMLRAGSVSPLELIDVVERRISATEPLVHATPITCFERARERAQQLKKSTAQTGRGFLHGLPVLIKDPSQGSMPPHNTGSQPFFQNDPKLTLLLALTDVDCELMNSFNMFQHL